MLAGLRLLLLTPAAGLYATRNRGSSVPEYYRAASIVSGWFMAGGR
jgi:hypothetical protein